LHLQDSVNWSGANAFAYGGLAHKWKDRLYLLRSGFAYASPWIVTGPTVRPAGVVLISGRNLPFTVEINGRRWTHTAFLLSGNVQRCLDARDVDLVSFNLAPSSPLFPSLRGVPAPGGMPLDREAFESLDPYIASLLDGCPPEWSEASRLFNDVVGAAIAQLPTAPSYDPRVRQMLAALRLCDDESDGQSLRRLSSCLGLSYHRTSHLFSSLMGIPVRSYLAWERQRRLYRPLLTTDVSLTQVAHDGGLPDSAYLSRIYQRWYGQRPSYARSKSVQVFSGADV